MRRDGRARGFTLIEIIATLTIVSVTMLGLVVANQQNMDRAIEASTREICVMLCQNRLEQAIVGVLQEEGGGFKDMGDGFDGYGWRRTDAEVTVVGDEVLHRVTISVTGQATAKPVSVSLSTYTQ